MKMMPTREVAVVDLGFDIVCYLLEKNAQMPDGIKLYRHCAKFFRAIINNETLIKSHYLAFFKLKVLAIESV